MVCQKGFSKSSLPKSLNRHHLKISFSLGEHANSLMLTGTPRPGCRRTFSPGSFCSTCKLLQHLLEIRLTETSTCYMTERTGGEQEYWQRYQHSTAVFPIVQHCAQQYSQRSLVQHTESVGKYHSHITNRRQIFKGSLWLLLHRPRPQTHEGAGLPLQPPLVGLSRATVKNETPTFLTLLTLKPSTCQWCSMLTC